MNTKIRVLSSRFAVLIQAATLNHAFAAATPQATDITAMAVAFNNVQSAATPPRLDDRMLAVNVASALNPQADAGSALATAGESNAQPSQVPEPATWALLLAGAVGLMVLKRHLLRGRS